MTNSTARPNALAVALLGGLAAWAFLATLVALLLWAFS